MRQSSRWVVFAACVVLFGPFLVRQACNQSKPVELSARVSTAPEVSQQQAVPLPREYAALPLLSGEGYPPSQAIDAICENSEGMRERFLAAAKVASVEQSFFALTAPPWGLDRCTNDDFCTWALQHAADSEAAGQVLWRSLASCEGEAIENAFASGQVPGAAKEHRALMQRLLHDPPLAPPISDSLVLQVSDPNVNRERLLREKGLPAVLAALKVCLEPRRVALGAGLVAVGPDLCLRWLAELDRAEAVRQAQRLAPLRIDLGLRPVVAALSQFPEEGALEKHLASLGMLEPPHRPKGPADFHFVKAGAPITVVDLLTRAGRATVLSAEDGEGVTSARVLRVIGRAVEPAFDHVFFLNDQRDLSVVSAYVDSGRLSINGPALGAWFDGQSLEKLANAFLQARQATVRVLSVVRTESEQVVLVSGPPAALAKLTEAGLLVPETAETQPLELNDSPILKVK